MKLAELGEFGFIDRIRERTPGAAAGVRLGIGDDCAALELPPGELLLTTSDLLIEDVHFRRRWTDLEALGHKSVAVNLSDIAAMGGTPRFLYLGLGIPADLEVAELDRFVAGFLAAADAYGAALTGGDTCASPGPLLVSVTAEGSVPEAQLVPRTGARPGDALYVSGTLGDSALALHQLERGRTPEPFLARRHHRPDARVDLGRALAAAGIPSAMIDLSDGLLADLGQVAKASGAGAKVAAAQVPLSAEFRRACRNEAGLLELALAGGEDYELLVTVPPEREAVLQRLAPTLGTTLTRVGEMVPAEGGVGVVDRSGRPLAVGRSGYRHFALSSSGGRARE